MDEGEEVKIRASCRWIGNMCVDAKSCLPPLDPSLTLPFSTKLVNMTISQVFCSHTICQKSSSVLTKGPVYTGVSCQFNSHRHACITPKVCTLNTSTVLH